MKHAWPILLFILSLAPCVPAFGQQPLEDASGERVGLRFTVSTKTPYIALLPDGVQREEDLYALARKLNHLHANVLIITPSSLYSNPHADAQELVEGILTALKALKRITDAPIVLMGQERGAAVALMAALHDFRVKGVIATSPGEYFRDRATVQRALRLLRIHVLALHTESEKNAVHTLLSHVPPELLITSGTLQQRGYSTLLSDSAESGAAWLAISIFYNERFGSLSPPATR